MAGMWVVSILHISVAQHALLDLAAPNVHFRTRSRISCTVALTINFPQSLSRLWRLFFAHAPMKEVPKQTLKTSRMNYPEARCSVQRWRLLSSLGEM